MTYLDRFIQRWRIRVASGYIKPTDRVLDVGCADGQLALQVPCGFYVGCDTQLPVEWDNADARPEGWFFEGAFPGAVALGLLQAAEMGAPPELCMDEFDAITMLAVLEHIPREQQPWVMASAGLLLREGGKLIITVPSPMVDNILGVLKFLRLIHGMSLEEHYGFDIEMVPALGRGAGLVLQRRVSFQAGLNNLFVFRKPFVV